MKPLDEEKMDEGTAGIEKAMRIKEDEDTDECPHCDSDPCVAKEMYPNFLTISTIFCDTKSNKQMRFQMYKEATKFIHGPGLGKGVRRKLPACVECMIRDIAPDESYKGYVEAEDNNKDN